jgi:adenosylhomocysteine nucleosidase
MWHGEREGENIEIVAVAAGMGAAAARRAFTAAEFGGSLDVVLSVGWAGALTDECRPGEAYIVSQVIDAQTGERFSIEGGEGPRLVTTAQVADAQDKRRLAETYGAALVDMEAATVARLAQMRDIPFFCCKGVSDGVDADLPDLNPFIDVDGQLKLTAFLAHVAIRPQFWAQLWRLGRNSSAAANSIADVTGAFLEVSYFDVQRNRSETGE